MDQQADQEKEQSKMLDTNIKQFIAATRQHFLEKMPSPEAAIATPTPSIH
jgi:hypothetical protein